MGVAYCITLYKKSHSHGHRVNGPFSNVVTGSQAVTSIVAVSTVHIGVTTPCNRSQLHSTQRPNKVAY